MSHRKIIVTTGAALAALFASLGGQVQANVSNDQGDSMRSAAEKTGLESRDIVLQRMMYRLGQDNHSLTLHRSEAGILYAGHGSHASHASHASHSSHMSGR
jgi:hypothetical protein